jgi:membrane peptidoglycan carboxypeptidase
MSDRPPRENNGETQQSGGWRTPQTPGRWHKPETEPTPQEGGWEKIPALPEELEAEPTSAGAWHLPNPSDTPYSPDDQLEVTTPLPFSDDTPATPPPAPTQTAQPPVTERGGDTVILMPPPSQPSTAEPSQPAVSPEDELLSLVSNASTEADRQRQADSPAVTPPAPEDVMFMLDKIEDDDDFDTFSMSELVALASLVDEEPRANVTPGASAPATAPVVPAPPEDDDDFRSAVLSPAERAVMGRTGGQPAAPVPPPSGTGAQPAATNDPAEYARQQLAALEASQAAAAEEAAPVGQATIPVDSSPTTGTPAQPDPGEYARQQLAALEGGGTGALGATAGIPPAPAQPAVDPRTEELARRYSETEDEVRSLRAMLQAGQITQEQFEEQLRQLMILDDDQVWWMMGAETDTWYKFVDGEWVVASPPRVQQSGTGQYVYEPLPTLDSQPQRTQYGYEDPDEITLDENNMPIPRAGVPTIDPNRTIVSPNYFNDDRAGATVVSPAVSDYGGVTVPNPVVGSGQPTVASLTVPSASASGYGSIESPIDTSAPPITDLAVDAPTYEDVARTYRSNLARNVILAALVIFGLLFAIGIGGVFFILAWYNGIVSDYENEIVGLVNYQPAFQTVRLLDYQDRPLATLSLDGAERINVSLNEISPYMIHAVISTENERFYEDPGWDFAAIVRAFFQNLSAGEIESGASTITQQVARALIVQDAADSEAERKLHEAVVAGELTSRYSKDFILELYLNEFFFGNQSYGVEAASQFYFDIPAANLNLPQSAMLAGLIQAPGQYDPVGNPQAAFNRMNYVLERMATVGCLNFTHNNERFCVTEQDIRRGEAIFQKAQVETRRYLPREFDYEYPHFVTLVQQQLESAFGEQALYTAGFTVRTTFVPELHDFAQARLRDQLRLLQQTGATQGSVIITDPRTGAIRAYVGSEDFFDEDNAGQVDYIRTYQQPGSAIKPILYTAAFEGLDRNGNGTLDQGEYLTPASIVWDVPTTYPTTPPYTPVNFFNTYYGPVSVRTALQGSYNVSAVKTYEFVGTEFFRNVAERMGLTFEQDAIFGLPTALGATEVRLYDMMKAYGTIANDGQLAPLYAIEAIADRSGGEIRIPEQLRPVPAQVISPQTAYLMQDILTDNDARRASGGFPDTTNLTLPALAEVPNLGPNDWVGVKTGTSNQNRDLWTVGFVSNAAVGVWIGRPDDGPIANTGSYEAAASLWRTIMTETVRSSRQRPEPFTPPPEVVNLRVCPDTGALEGGNCASPIRNEFFAANRRPPNPDQGFVTSVTVNTWNNLIANDFCPEDRQAITVANINDSAAIAWLNSAAGRPVAQRLALPTPVRSVPQGACDQNTIVPTANITNPPSGATVQEIVQITGQVSAPANFNRYELAYAPVNSNNYASIGSFNTQQTNPNSILAQWDTRGVPDGQYNLRLIVFSNDNGFVNRVIPINIDNPEPTATPTLTPSLTPTLAPPTEFIPPTNAFATLPPLPFDPVAGPSPTVNTQGS